MKVEITPEVIEALRTLRDTRLNHYGPLWDALNVLDNAGIFSAIDEATGYDVDPAPEWISKCTCLPSVPGFGGAHSEGCPEAPVSKCTCPRTYGGEFLRMGHRDGCAEGKAVVFGPLDIQGRNKA